MKFEHGPMSNSLFLASILGFFFTYSIWSVSETWGFVILLSSIIIFVASFVSATRAPLDSDEEIELAIHEKYKKGKRYPDTDIEAHIREKQFRQRMRANAERNKPKKKKARKKKAAKKKSVKKKVAKKK